MISTMLPKNKENHNNPQNMTHSWSKWQNRGHPQETLDVEIALENFITIELLDDGEEMLLTSH